MMLLLLLVLAVVFLVVFSIQMKELKQHEKKNKKLFLNMAIVCLGFAIGVVSWTLF